MGKSQKRDTAPLYFIVNINGAYLSNPKWRKKRIRGNVTVRTKKIVMPEELILDDGKSVVKSTTPNTVASPILTQEDLSTLYTEKYSEVINPKYASRTESLDNIFNPDALGQMVLVFDRSEWDKHLSYCDYDLSHEESVVAKGFYFTKDNKEWYFNDIGFRIRGNTSRRIPQEFSKDEFEKKVKENPANNHLRIEVEVERPIIDDEPEIEVDESNKPDFLVQYEQIKK